MQTSPLPSPDVPLILEGFSAFFSKAVSSHPRKSQILGQMNAFLGFLANNRDDLAKGYQFLREMKQSQSTEEKKLELAFQSYKPAESNFSGFKEVIEFDSLQEMRTLNCDARSFSYDLLLLCVSVRFFDILMSQIDQQALNLLQTIKERIFHDTLAQAVQDKILAFLEHLEEIAKTDACSYKRAFAKVLSAEKPTDFLVTMVPVLKQIIIKFLINSEWNFVREKLQDKLNTNSLNQIFTLFKNQSNFPQKDPEVQILEENTQNFIQILALGLNLNIRVLWNNANLEGEKNSIVTKLFQAKKQEDAIGTVTVLVAKSNGNWSYYNLEKSETSNVEENLERKTSENKEPSKENFKHFKDFSKSPSIKVTEETIPLGNIAKQGSEEHSSVSAGKKRNAIGSIAIKPAYLLDFLASFIQKSEEIDQKVFTPVPDLEAPETKKPSYKRYQSSEFEQKTEIDEAPFLSNKRPAETMSAGLRTQANLTKMGFIQKCAKCPKEYVEYEVKKDAQYLCYVCR